MRLRKVLFLGVAVMGLLGLTFPSFAQQSPDSQEQLTSTARLVAAQQRSSPDGLPDSPGTIRSAMQEKEKQPADLETQSKLRASAEPQTVPLQQQSSQPSPQNPVGTAAAEPSKVSGVAGSQPAGVAIAPAKQHRARTIAIRVGAIVGAGVAVGTVVALTQATSSKPPGTK